MDVSSRTAQLCLAGTRAEFERRVDDARRLYVEAWHASADDRDAAMAAHYVAHLTADPADALHWHRVAIARALRDPRAVEFLGSLWLSLGGAHEAVGDAAEAERCFGLAAEHGLVRGGA